MTRALALEAERLRSGRAFAAFYSLPVNRQRLLDLAASLGVEGGSDPGAVVVACKLAEAGDTFHGLDVELVAVAAGRLTAAAVKSTRARELERLEDLDRENAAAHERLQARAKEEAGKSAARGIPAVAPKISESHELIDFAAKWAALAEEYGLLPTLQGVPSAGDVRQAIVRRVAVLGRVLDDRLRAEGEPTSLAKLRRSAAEARIKQADLAMTLEAARTRARLVPCPETHQVVEDAATQLNAAAGAAAAIAGRVWKEWGVAA